jgi:pseudaminic acid synthase
MILDGKGIGLGLPAFIVAEMSANHLQDRERAESILRAAKEAGADAIKLQTYTPEGMTLCSNASPFRVRGGTVWDGSTLYDLYSSAATPWDWYGNLNRLAERNGLALFSTPFDSAAVDYLEEMAVPAYKIASFEVVDMPLLKRVAATGKPVIMSTGMTTLEELSRSVRTLREHGCEELALLKCISSYPAPPEEMNLRTIPHMAEAFQCPTGLSDHSMGSAAAVAAVSLGACIVEKHLTLCRADGGPDAAFSMEPGEFAAMVTDIRTAEAALGTVTYEPTAAEVACRRMRRSLFAVEDIKQGEVFTETNVRSIRPGDGLSPFELDRVLGRAARTDIERGTPLAWELIA